MSSKPTLIVASHKTNSDAEAETLEKQIAARHPEFDVIVIPQATGVVLVPAEAPKPEPKKASTRVETTPASE